MSDTAVLALLIVLHVVAWFVLLGPVLRRRGGRTRRARLPRHRITGRR